MRCSFSLRLSIFAPIAVFLLSVAPARAQVSGGLASISGIVRDATGATVPGAQVVVSNGSKGINLSLITSDGGIFNAPSLPPASGYNVTVNKPGFTTYKVNDIDLVVGQDLNIVAPLTVASSTTQVEVIGTAPLVDDTKTDVSQVIGSQQILELPELRTTATSVCSRFAEWRTEIRFCSMATILRTNSMAKTMAGRASRLRFRRMPCKNFR
jgi:hypothetical protein